MGNPLKIEFSAKRVYGLDILRAVAIITVIFAHGGRLLPVRLSNFQNYYLVDGVFLFFVLSGFLIGSILIKILESSKATPRMLLNFWTRRWFRTIPNYLLILVVLIITSNLFYGGVANANILHYFLFFQNFNFPMPAFFNEAWTLSVEEWFYLLVPAVLFVLVGIGRMRPRRAIVSTAIAIIIASLAFRLYRYASFPPVSVTDWDMHIRKEVITRLDSLMFGVLGAYFAYYRKAAWIRHKNALFGVGLGIIASQQALSLYIASGSRITETGFGLYLTVPYFTVSAFGILLLLPLLSELKAGSGRVYNWLTHISIISYSMYLIHVSIIQAFVYWLTKDSPTHSAMIVRYALYWSLTISIATLLYKCYELPTTNLREKFVRKRYGPVPENVLDAEANRTTAS